MTNGKHWKQHTDKLKSIPKERWTKKVWRTVLGVFVIAVGVGLEYLFPYLPDWLLIGLVGYGFYAISGDLVRGFLGFIPAAIRDIRAAIFDKE